MITETPSFLELRRRQAVGPASPQALVLALDDSSSLGELVKGTGQRLFDHLYDSVDATFDALARESSKTGHYDDRFHIAVIRFSDTLRNGLEHITGPDIQFLPGSELFPFPDEKDANGSGRHRYVRRGSPDGMTNMSAAVSKAGSIIGPWTAANPNNENPRRLIVFSDGEYNTGGSPASAFRDLQAQGVMCYVALFRPEGGEVVRFPVSEEEVSDRYSKELFQYASVIPHLEIERARKRELPVRDGARALVVNGSMEDLGRFMEWASTRS